MTLDQKWSILLMKSENMSQRMNASSHHTLNIDMIGLACSHPFKRCLAGNTPEWSVFCSVQNRTLN